MGLVERFSPHGHDTHFARVFLKMTRESLVNMRYKARLTRDFLVIMILILHDFRTMQDFHNLKIISE